MSEPQSTPDFPEPDVDVESIDPETLKSRIDDGEPVTILDTRMESEFDDWKIEGESVESINRPYYEFLDGELTEENLEGLPEDRQMTVVCAKGESSDYVAGLLAEEGYEVDHLAEGMNGWASIYESYELESAGDATVVQYQRPSSGCLGYLVVDGDEAAVVDPLRYFSERYVDDAAEYGADLTYAIDTHIHADHISGVRELAREHGVTAVVPEQSLDRGVDYDVDYETLDDGESVTVGETTVEAIYTPGHTTGMTSYKVEEFLFTGDGLFTESVARPDLEDGDEGAPDAAAMLYDTLHEKILTLPDDTVVAPAHFSDAATPAGDGSYTATLGDLQSSMDALSMDREEFVEFILSDMPPRPANYEDIIATNMGKQSADDEEAFELELGPNNCAASREAMTSDD